MTRWAQTDDNVCGGIELQVHATLGTKLNSHTLLPAPQLRGLLFALESTSSAAVVSEASCQIFLSFLESPHFPSKSWTHQLFELYFIFTIMIVCNYYHYFLQVHYNSNKWLFIYLCLGLGTHLLVPLRGPCFAIRVHSWMCSGILRDAQDFCKANLRCYCSVKF